MILKRARQFAKADGIHIVHVWKWLLEETA